MKLNLFFSSFFFFFLICSPSFSQIKSVLIGIDGLHCSACSFGTEKSLRQLDFVQDIKMDLNKHIAEVNFKSGKEIVLEMLAQKVIDAGFSVRSMDVLFDFNNLSIINNYCYEFDKSLFNFIGVKEQTLKNSVSIHLIGQNYMSKSEFKKWKKLITNPACNAFANGPFSKKLYFVTIQE